MIDPYTYFDEWHEHISEAWLDHLRRYAERGIKTLEQFLSVQIIDQGE